jgi:hypothetical protein
MSVIDPTGLLFAPLRVLGDGNTPYEHKLIMKASNRVIIEVLELAIEHDNVARLRTIVQLRGLRILTMSARRFPIIAKAMQHGSYAMVTEFLRLGMNKYHDVEDQVDHKWYNPLSLSLATTNISAVQALIDGGVCPLVSYRGTSYGVLMVYPFHLPMAASDVPKFDTMLTKMLSVCTVVDFTEGYAEVGSVRAAFYSPNPQANSYFWRTRTCEFVEVMEHILTRHGKHLNHMREVTFHQNDLFMWVFTNCSFEACVSLVNAGAFTPFRRLYIEDFADIMDADMGRPVVGLRARMFTNVLLLPPGDPKAPKKLSRVENLDFSVGHPERMSEIQRLLEMIRETRRVYSVLKRTTRWANAANALPDVAGRRWTPKWHTLPMTALATIRMKLFADSYNWQCKPRDNGYYERVNMPSRR